MTRAIRRHQPRRVSRPARGGPVLADLLTAYRAGRMSSCWDWPGRTAGRLRGGPIARRALGCVHRSQARRPGHEEFAVGALASGGRWWSTTTSCAGCGSPRATAGDRRARGPRAGAPRGGHRGGRPPLDVTGKTVILVDDGLATGSSMMAAVQALRSPIRPRSSSRCPPRRNPPAGSSPGSSRTWCASMPTPFLAVGESFWDFSQVSDEEVQALLAADHRRSAGTRPAQSGRAGRPRGRRRPGRVPPADVLDDLIGDARVVLIGERARTAPTSSTTPGLRSPSGSSRTRGSMPLRPKRIGPTPTG